MVGGLLEKLVAKAQTRIEEKWDSERLKDGGVTSASDESSVVLYGDCGSNCPNEYKLPGGRHLDQKPAARSEARQGRATTRPTIPNSIL
jgi:hypothetical protein